MRRAVLEIGAFARVVAASRVYETLPVGGPPQPNFLNAAVLVSTTLDARGLLDALLAVEAKLGRVRDVRNGPRIVDLDLLWIDGVVLDATDLVVPHPRLLDRAFALVPLLEVARGAIDPRTRAAIEPLQDASGVTLTALTLLD